MDLLLAASFPAAAEPRIYFGHQSVGANILQGVKELGPTTGLRLSIKDELLAENGDPLRKLENFKAAASTPTPMRERCSSAIAPRSPSCARKTRAPFSFTPARRAPYGTIENVRREEYNRLLRAAYAGREPIFDLARLESIAPDGSAVSVTWDGATAPAMSPAYTDDGGHLTGVGLETTTKNRGFRDARPYAALVKLRAGPDQRLVGRPGRSAGPDVSGAARDRVAAPLARSSASSALGS